jgi:2OG-Fe(II) oxygenase superfamily
MIHMTRQGLAFTGMQEGAESLRRCFERQHYLLLKEFLVPEIISIILPILGRAEYLPAQYNNVGSELRMEPNLAFDTLSFLANDMKLFGLVQTITGCGSIGCFQGRVYKLIPDPLHNFEWHDDLRDASRLVAMSINLTEGMFRGGVLQIREVHSGKITGEVSNTEIGNAVLFRISEDLEHRVTGIEGDTPRISFAGWFKSEPVFHSHARQVRADKAAETSEE